MMRRDERRGGKETSITTRAARFVYATQEAAARNVSGRIISFASVRRVYERKGKRGTRIPRRREKCNGDFFDVAQR